MPKTSVIEQKANVWDDGLPLLFNVEMPRKRLDLTWQPSFRP